MSVRRIKIASVDLDSLKVGSREVSGYDREDKETSQLVTIKEARCPNCGEMIGSEIDSHTGEATETMTFPLELFRQPQYCMDCGAQLIFTVEEPNESQG